MCEDTSVTGTPASRIALAVPPVERSVAPTSTNPFANSTTPVLSDTLINAWFNPSMAPSFCKIDADRG